VRDAEANRCVRLPVIDRDRFVNGFPRADLHRRTGRTPGPLLPDGFVFQAGQPEEVRAAYRRAMGLEPERRDEPVR
jgi:5,5'-dehydrodivanillate O-demethylase